jgi:hypothetical protein
VPTPARSPRPGLLGPVHGWQLAPYTNPDGYKVQDRIDFGVPLHFRIPNRVKDCFSAYDLKPGQFAVPFAITVKNLLPQQGVAITPGMYATYDGQPDSYGQVTSQSLDVTSVGSALWGDGTCSSDTRQTPPAGGTVVMYGFIGPGHRPGAPDRDHQDPVGRRRLFRAGAADAAAAFAAAPRRRVLAHRPGRLEPCPAWSAT